MKTKKPILVLIVAAFAAFLSTFNETFLNIAFTPIMKDFGVGISTVQWLTTAYMLGAAIMVPISSFMYRKYRTKPLFLFTVGLLLIGSIMCAVAPNFSVLLTGRIIQSIGTGMLIPIGMNMTLSVVPKEKIGTYMGVMGAMTTLGPSFSIISCGTLLNFGSWHLLFCFFGFLTALLFILGLIILGKTERLDNSKLDTLSVILISLSLIGILYGLSTIFSGSLVIAILAVIIGIVFTVCFVRRQNKIKEPLINLNTLEVKPFKVGVIINMLALILVFALNIIMPLYIQNALGVSAFLASLTLFPAIICACVFAPIAGKIYDKNGAKVILPLGFTIMFIFILLIALFRDSNSLLLIGLLFIPVIGSSSLIIGPVQSFALSHLKREQNPHGVTVMSTGFQIAGCIGSSLFTGVYALSLNMKSDLSLAFLITMILTCLFALIGFIISLKVRRYEIEREIPLHMTLRSIMKKDVYTVLESDSLKSALKFIADKSISGVPVVNKSGKLTGFISDGDIMRYLSKTHPLFVNAYSFAAIASEDNDFDDKLNALMKLKVKDIVRKKVVAVDINTGVEDVCRILTERHLKKAPVMENGKMVGIINRSNITKYVVDSYLSLAK